ncbi:hypothetical protein BpHYR1_002174 [Brachionus plicatilis]|uniref:Uncharacterized protein n=1 Tax=Brachionus plicatilis TaxID=10195 RepID=A0A3M7Q9V9_BRAPC|nr:hypothetical protein BpHYR1_002174 [Brachionus plicatilis]
MKHEIYRFKKLSDTETNFLNDAIKKSDKSLVLQLLWGFAGKVGPVINTFLRMSLNEDFYFLLFLSSIIWKIFHIKIIFNYFSIILLLKIYCLNLSAASRRFKITIFLRTKPCSLKAIRGY